SGRVILRAAREWGRSRWLCGDSAGWRARGGHGRGATVPPMHSLEFDNAFLRELPGDPEAGPRLRQVQGAAWSRVEPTPVAAPRLVAHSPQVAAALGFSEADVASPEFARVFAGNALFPGMEPFAANYGGHQFGNW